MSRRGAVDVDDLLDVAYELDGCAASDVYVEPQRAHRMAWAIRRAVENAEHRESVRHDAAEALEWVEEHGGLDDVEAEWEYAHERTGLANSVAVRLGVDPLTDADISGEVMGELDRRLMPDGCEWPVFEDGFPVRIGDAVRFGDEEMRVEGVELRADGFELHGRCDAVSSPCAAGYAADERVKRPETDSWERLEEDAGKGACDYFGHRDDECCGCPASGKGCEETMARDLVRRARALAEKGGR